MEDGGLDRETGFEHCFHIRPQPQRVGNGFNAVMMVPTGIGSTIGGHAGDAAPAAQLLSSVCDQLILHPNVVNASDINEQPKNALYVEGSVITRLLLGNVGLSPVRRNRILLVVDDHKESIFVDYLVNAANAARASMGIDICKIVTLNPHLGMAAEFSPESKRAAGTVSNIQHLLQAIEANRGGMDAVAISSVITVPDDLHTAYFQDPDKGAVNPWGGVEAILTHAVTSMCNLPSAHAPMFINSHEEAEHRAVGRVDARMAAEVISRVFTQCVFKGLHQSPRIVVDESAMREAGVLTAGDVDCIVMPDKCLGVPTLAALEQGIPVIAVMENENILDNDLQRLPWAPNQFFQVRSYAEAVGVMVALREGIPLETTQRPIQLAPVEAFQGTVADSRAVAERASAGVS